MNTPNQEPTELSLAPEIDVSSINMSPGEKVIVDKIKEIDERRATVARESLEIKSKITEISNTDNPQKEEIIMDLNNKLDKLATEKTQLISEKKDLERELLELQELQRKNPYGDEHKRRGARPDTLAI